MQALNIQLDSVDINQKINVNAGLMQGSTKVESNYAGPSFAELLQSFNKDNDTDGITKDSSQVNQVKDSDNSEIHKSDDSLAEEDKKNQKNSKKEPVKKNQDLDKIPEAVSQEIISFVPENTVVENSEIKNEISIDVDLNQSVEQNQLNLPSQNVEFASLMEKFNVKEEGPELSELVDPDDKNLLEKLKSDVLKKSKDSDFNQSKNKQSKNTEKKITVIDERGSLSKEINAKESKSKLHTEVTSSKNNQLDLTMTVEQNAHDNILVTNNQSASADGSAFQSMLRNNIQQNAPEFVKATNIVLRDSNNGTINMILKPEALGNVKIRVELTDKGVQGVITVQSEEAFNAFKDSLADLKNAFKASGFEDAGFRLDLANNGSNSDSQNHGQNQNFINQMMANNYYEENFTSFEEFTSDNFSNAEVNYNSKNLVNIVA